MGKNRLMTLRAKGDIRHLQMMMRSPHISSGLRFLFLRYRHYTLSFKCSDVETFHVLLEHEQVFKFKLLPQIEHSPLQ